jgi:oligoendopeptidase F
VGIPGIAWLVAGLLATTAAGQTGEVKTRDQIDAKYKWDLSAMYAGQDAWEADMKAIEAAIPQLKAFDGKVTKSPEQFLAYMKLYEQTAAKLDNAYTYAAMSFDQDTSDQRFTALKERAADMTQRLGDATSWFSPEVTAMPREAWEKWFAGSPGMNLYRQMIDNQLRVTAHVLSPAEERLLALSSNMARTPGNANVALRETDMVFPTIQDENGEDIQLSEGRLFMLLQSPDPAVRRNASITMLETYGQYKNTAAALMAGNVARDIFYARARNYPSSLAASVDNDNVDTTVVLNLINTVKKNAGTLQRYCELRRKALGLDEIHLYDMYAPMLPETRIEVAYDDAVKTIEAAMAPLGEDYVRTMKAGFAGGWVDVYENRNKRSGAYSTATFLSHPYILLNHNDTMEDMFTIAHEMGHAMHSSYTLKTQPFVYADYTIFVAEVASTLNEALLLDHLMKREKDPVKKLALVEQYIGNIRGTLITQTMFADFEYRMHRAAESGTPLTSDTLSQMYRDTARDYFGPNVVIDDAYGYTWIRIPHFYRNFYVYKYATSLAASQAIVQNVLNGKAKAREDYIRFLSGGSSKYPIDLLKDAGVDMSTPAPIEMTMKKFDELVTEMERLLEKAGKI